jgi:hypothetical protein
MGRTLTDFQRKTDSNIPFTALKAGTTEDVGAEPASGRDQSAVGPEISRETGYSLNEGMAFTRKYVISFDFKTNLWQGKIVFCELKKINFFSENR